MNMRQRSNKILNEWAFFWIMNLVLFAALAAVWVVFVDPLIPHDTEKATSWTLALVAVHQVLFWGLFILFFRRLWLAHDPIEYREAREGGLPAQAKVLEIKRTRWRKRRTRTLTLQVVQARYEHEMRVRISREGQPDYEVTFAEYLESDEIPKKGATIPVKVHPTLPEVIVLDRDAISTNNTRASD